MILICREHHNTTKSVVSKMVHREDFLIYINHGFVKVTDGKEEWLGNSIIQSAPDIIILHSDYNG